MSYVEISFNSKDVKPENQEQVCAAVSQLLRLTNDYPGPSGVKPSVAVDGVVAEAYAPVEVVQTTIAPPAPAKPKRKRRTKAQIAADKAAAEPVPPLSPVSATAVEAAPAEVVDVDPLGDVPDQPTVATEDEVKAAVVAAVNRLTEAGNPSPTRYVVDKLVELTGKKRVGEIEAGLYRTVIGGLSEI